MKSDLWIITHEATAWDSIGVDGQTFRIKGGRALYDAVIYYCHSARSNNVRLARLGDYVGTIPMGLRQYNRSVHPDTVLEFLKPREQTN